MFEGISMFGTYFLPARQSATECNAEVAQYFLGPTHVHSYADLTGEAAPELPWSASGLGPSFVFPVSISRI